MRHKTNQYEELLVDGDQSVRVVVKREEDGDYVFSVMPCGQTTEFGFIDGKIDQYGRHHHRQSPEPLNWRKVAHLVVRAVDRGILLCRALKESGNLDYFHTTDPDLDNLQNEVRRGILAIQQAGTAGIVARDIELLKVMLDATKVTTAYTVERLAKVFKEGLHVKEPEGSIFYQTICNMIARLEHEGERGEVEEIEAPVEDVDLTPVDLVGLEKKVMELIQRIQSEGKAPSVTARDVCLARIMRESVGQMGAPNVDRFRMCTVGVSHKIDSIISEMEAEVKSGTAKI